MKERNMGENTPSAKSAGMTGIKKVALGRECNRKLLPALDGSGIRGGKRKGPEEERRQNKQTKQAKTPQGGN